VKTFRLAPGLAVAAAALLASGQTVTPELAGGLPGPKADTTPKPGSHTRKKGKPFEQGRNAVKRSIPNKRKHRARLRAAIEGRLTGRPLTETEKGWMDK